MTLRALDLFCGACGGWSVGLHENGIETVAACEIDPWRRERFASNFPQARMYDDVRTLTADRLLSDLGFVPEVIVGSPPCQDASTANHKGKGVDGERTGLFFEAVRLVRELRPVWVCLENVPGLRTRGYDRVHDELEAAGYTVRPLVVGAWHAGAPHRRNRVWIVADADKERRKGLRKPLGNEAQEAVDRCDGASWDASDASRTDPTRGHTNGGRIGWTETLAGWSHWNGGPPDLGRMDDALPKGMARKMLSAYGDAVVPKITGAVIRSIQVAHSEQLARGRGR